MWYLGVFASFLNVLAVGKLDVSLLAAPVQILLFNVAIVTAILVGRKVSAKKRTK